MIKPGSGVFVAEVNSKPMSESLSSVLRIQKTSLNELTEARIILEPSIARLASERMMPDQEDLADASVPVLCAYGSDTEVVHLSPSTGYRILQEAQLSEP